MLPKKNPTAHSSGLSSDAARASVTTLLGDAGMAAEQYSTLEPQRNATGFNIHMLDRTLGLLAQSMGNMDQAAAHLRRRPGLLPQGGLPAGVGVDLSRLRRRP